MIDLRPAEPWVADVLRPQAVQLVSGMTFNRHTLATAIRTGVTLAVHRDEEPVAVGGLLPVWDDRAVAWGVLSSGIRATMTPIHRIVSRVLEGSRFRRVEAYVDADHLEGLRWIALLGFKEEGVMRSFFQGRDFVLFARIKE